MCSKFELKTKKPIADAFSVEANESFGIIGPVFGAPAVGVVMEYLAAAGVEEVFFIGACGSLDPERSFGDVIYPRGAISEEGTTKLYGADEKIEFSSKKQEALEFKLPGSSGTIWSTDAPYRETSEKVAHYKEAGAIAVEMEFSALACLSERFEIDLAAAFVVTDVFKETSWEAGFSKKEVKESFTKFLELIPTQ